jgi:hypothetical protein
LIPLVVLAVVRLRAWATHAACGPLMEFAERFGFTAAAASLHIGILSDGCR